MVVMEHSIVIVLNEVKQMFPAKPGLWSRGEARAEADAKLDEVMAALGCEGWRAHG